MPCERGAAVSLLADQVSERYGTHVEDALEQQNEDSCMCAHKGDVPQCRQLSSGNSSVRHVGAEQARWSGPREAGRAASLATKGERVAVRVQQVVVKSAPSKRSASCRRSASWIGRRSRFQYRSRELCTTSCRGVPVMQRCTRPLLPGRALLAFALVVSPAQTLRPARRRRSSSTRARVGFGQ
ncbi:hypothetical protein AAT19DRAFT_11617 [Rhodotorula toruloides]|uniref:Uncharacterized protein n=1 Tax=Rhodotorula toruloides TaxID=5286 RepID=A0A2S9ZW42_RHOTO|nr:hypothetical protein AAT19DRAFT_11617 [Rhodotorula toruloides]